MTVIPKYFYAWKLIPYDFEIQIVPMLILFELSEKKTFHDS